MRCHHGLLIFRDFLARKTSVFAVICRKSPTERFETEILLPAPFFV
jgi:hypothetical protein